MLYMYIVGDTNSSLVGNTLLNQCQCSYMSAFLKSWPNLGQSRALVTHPSSFMYLENSCQIRLAQGLYCIRRRYQNSLNYNKNCKNI